MKIHFITTATTGETRADELLAVAIGVWDSERETCFEMRYLAYFHPLGEVSEAAARSTGYSVEQWAGLMPGPKAEIFSAGAARTIADELGGLDYWCGANPAVDRAALERAFERVRVPFPMVGTRSIDTGSMAAPLALLGTIPSTHIANVAAHYLGDAPERDVKLRLLQLVNIFERLVADAVQGFAS